MFTGIVECTSNVKQVVTAVDSLRVILEKPSDFNDLKIGDSVAVDGVCLTVETFDDSSIEFVAANETLRVTGWNQEYLLGRQVNLERPLCFGDRVHGHLVTGHVDRSVQILSRTEFAASLRLEFEVPRALDSVVWEKGTITLNGVNLTVNEVGLSKASVMLIPETLKRTNLKSLNTGDIVNIEGDYLAKGLARLAKRSVVVGDSIMRKTRGEECTV